MSDGTPGDGAQPDKQQRAINAEHAQAQAAIGEGVGRHLNASPSALAEAIAKVLGGQVPVAVVAAECVRERLAAAMLGMSVPAIGAARREGRWAEGKQWHRAADGTVWIDLPAVYALIRGQQ